MYQTAWDQAADESYWRAIVTQGKWAETAPSHRDGEFGRETQEKAAADETQAISGTDWHTLETAFARGDVMQLPVVGYNKGGILVEWRDIQGFVPASQLADTTVISEESERSRYLADRVGEQLDLKIIELDREKNRVIFSERAAAWGGCCPDDVLETLQPGDICTGRVSNLCDFGVFVDLGGVDGLIHVSELSWQRISHPSDVLEAGSEVEVYVIDVDRTRRRIALSLKRLQPNPWATVAERYAVGEVVEGKITNVVEFGAFTRIEDGVEGLIHVSEMDLDDTTHHPRSLVREGCTVRARILNIDPENQRIGLTMRGVTQREEDAPQKGNAPIEATVGSGPLTIPSDDGTSERY